MSNKIEKRTVEMRFDNAQYEKGIAQSIKSTKDFEKTLQFDGATKGLGEVQNGINKMNFDNANTGITGMINNFSMFKTIATGALLSVGATAASVASKMLNTLFVDTKKQGFQEYEMRIDSTRVLLNAVSESGKGLSDVNAALDELNEYADKTNYNFAQMTDAAGKFALTTGDLEGSITKVKGFSNLAADTGATNAQLQGTLYQLSQVSGAVRAMDWMSVRNNNMASKAFQDDLIERAKAMGTISQDTIALLESGASFQSTLEQEWLTTGVLDSVIAEYANDEEMTRRAGEVGTFTKMMSTIGEEVASGWAATWGYIIGDYHQSLEFFTGLKDGIMSLIGPSNEARNSMLKFWNENGGREAVLEGLTNIFGSLAAIIKTVGTAYRDVFPATTGEEAVKASEIFRDFTEIFKVNEKTLETFKQALTAIFYVLKIGVDIVTSVIGGMVTILGSLFNVFGAITNIITGFISGMLSIGDAASAIASPLLYVDDIIWNISKSIAGFINGVAAFLAFDSKSAGEAAGGFLEGIGNGIITILEGLPDFASRIIDMLITVLTGGLLIYLTQIMKFGKDIVAGVAEMLEGIQGILESYQQNIKAKTIQSIASAILTLAFAVLILALIPTELLYPAVTALGALMAMLFTFVNFMKTDNLVKLPSMLVSIGVSLLLISMALSNIAKIYEKYGLESFLIAGAAIAALGVGLVFLTKHITPQNLTGMSAGLMGFAASMVILSVALQIVASINPDRLTNALTAMGLIMAGLIAFTVIGDSLNPKALAKASVALYAFSIALTIIAASLLIFALVRWESILKAATMLVVVMASIAAAAFISSSLGSGTASLLAVSVLLIALAHSLMLFGLISYTNIEKAIVALASILTLLVGFSAIVAIFPAIGGVLITLGLALVAMGKGMLYAASAMLVFVTALALVGTASPMMAIGLTTIMGVLILFIDDFIRAIGEGIIGFLNIIAKSSGAIADAFIAVILAATKAINATVRPVVNTLLNFIYVVIDELGNYVKPIISATVKLLVNIVEGIIDELGGLVDGIFNSIFGDVDISEEEAALDTLISKTEELRKANEELTESSKNASETREDEVNNLDDYDDKVADLLERIESFADKGILSNAELQIMETLIGNLNELLPELGLSWDNDTGKLNQNTDALRANVDERLKSKYMDAYDGIITEVITEYVELEYDTSKLVSSRDEIGTKLTTYKDEMEELSKIEVTTSDDRKRMSELSGLISNSEKEYKALNNQVGEAKVTMKGLSEEHNELVFLMEVAGGATEKEARTIADSYSLLNIEVGEHVKGFTKNISTIPSEMIKIAKKAGVEGENTVTNYANGLGDTSKPSASAEKVSSIVLTKLQTVSGQTEGIGINALIGLSKGLQNKSWTDVLAGTASGIVSTVLNTMRRTAGENSPWKTTTESGKFAVEGLVYGMKQNAKKAADMSKQVIDSLIKPTEDIYLDIPSMDDDLGNPVIRPIMDLDNVRRGLSSLTNLFNGVEPILSAELAASTDTLSNSNQNGNTQTPIKETVQENVTFNQYNTSPKALSTTEIYRKTKSIVSKKGGPLV